MISVIEEEVENLGPYSLILITDDCGCAACDNRRKLVEDMGTYRVPILSPDAVPIIHDGREMLAVMADPARMPDHQRRAVQDFLARASGLPLEVIERGGFQGGKYPMVVWPTIMIVPPGYLP